MSFDQNIRSRLGDGTSRIPVHVHKDVFESDEALVQILSHEISEIEELRYRATRTLSVREYKELVRPDRPNNLHWQAVQDGDWWLQRFRDMQGKNN